MNRLHDLTELGQAIWLDYIHRDLIAGGDLDRLIAEDGVTGVTSNPAIFAGAITESTAYDAAIADLVEERPELTTTQLYEELAIEDIRAAADCLAPVWQRSDGVDGYVSLEVSPHLADDTDGTIAEATRFWRQVERPNLMIKVPATEAGIPAIEELLASGINVNITLMFSLTHYEAVVAAYLRGLERTAEPARMASVASFFVSRVDSRLDPLLSDHRDPAARELIGKIGIDNSRRAYRRFQEIFTGPRYRELAERGARVQRVLWASTSTKDPAYSDVRYVEELIGLHTVNTMPPKTLEAFRDHGESEMTLTRGVEESERRLARLEDLGISLEEETEALQREGVRKFAEPYDRLLQALDGRRESIQARLTASE